MKQCVVDFVATQDCIPPDRIMYRLDYHKTVGLCEVLEALLLIPTKRLPYYEQRMVRVSMLLIEPLQVKLQKLTKKPFSKQKSFALNQRMAEGFMLAYEKGFFNYALKGANPLEKAYYGAILYNLYEELGKHYQVL